MASTSWSITLELSITVLELSIMPLENSYRTDVTNDDHNMLIVHATAAIKCL
jgi:hypothetical protein